MNELVDYDDLHHVQNVINCTNVNQITHPNISSLRILYLNARSILSKVEEIQHLINTTYVPEIMIFSETWIRQNQIKYFQMEGFSSFLIGREDRTGGGVGILVRKNYGVSRVIYQFMSNIIEILVVQVKIMNQTYFFVSIYRPPIYLNASDQELYLMKLEEIMTKFGGKRTFIVGDQNLNLCGQRDDLINSYLDKLSQFNNVVMNNGFVTRPDSNTCLDHIIVDITVANEIRVQTLPYLNLDHLLLFIDVKLDGSHNSIQQPLYDVRKIINYDMLKLILPGKLCDVNDHMDVNQIYADIIKHIQDSLVECSNVKVTKRRHKFKRQWIDDELIQLIGIKNYWFRMRNYNRNNEFYETEYRKWRNIVTSKKREKRQLYNAHKFDKCGNDRRKTWNVMKEIMFDGPSNNNAINLLSYCTNDDEKQDKINDFNQFYASIGDDFKSTSLNISEVPERMIEDTKFEFKLINLDQTKNLIMKLKNKNSSGPDGISPKLVKILCDELTFPVMTLINKSLTSSCIPEGCKTARVIGIYKANDPNQVSNFRPISVTSVFGKLIEMEVNSQLALYVEENNIFSPEQYGFRSQSNTSSACFDLSNNVCINKDNGFKTCLIFVDSQKAYNSVKRNRLLLKLRKIGIQDKELNWFTNFLSNTRQYSECNIFKSSIANVHTGLMQGSILSPILFNIYSCDLSLMEFNGRFYSFADDLCFECTAKDDDSLEMIANENLEKFETYMNANCLTVNIDKTKFMIIGNTSRSLNVKYANKPLEEVSDYRYLGLTITNDLRWNKHIRRMNNNLSALAGVFWKISNDIPEQLKKSLYHSMFLSHVLYCISIYGSTTNNNIIQIQRVQNKAVKNLFERNRFDSPRLILQELKLLSIIDSYELFACAHIHMIKRKQLHSITQIEERHHTHDTRQRGNLWTCKIHSTTWGENNPLRRAVNLYNNLELSLKQEENVKSFKKKLRINLLEKSL